MTLDDKKIIEDMLSEIDSELSKYATLNEEKEYACKSAIKSCHDSTKKHMEICNKEHGVVSCASCKDGDDFYSCYDSFDECSFCYHYHDAHYSNVFGKYFEDFCDLDYDHSREEVLESRKDFLLSLLKCPNMMQTIASPVTSR